MGAVVYDLATITRAELDFRREAANAENFEEKFDEATDRSASGIVAGARFFHSIALPTDPNEQPPPFEHP